MSQDPDLEKSITSPTPPTSQPPLAPTNPNLITWNQPHDPNNPKNWSLSRKLLSTIIYLYTCFVTGVASSIFSSGNAEISKEFQVTDTIATLSLSLFLLGYTTGPPIWGPLSETYGRKPPLLLGMSLSTIFSIPVALAHNITAILICRFLQGLFGAAPLALISGGMVDMWEPTERAVAMTVGVGVIFGSPVVAPVLGGFLVVGKGWRWTEWVCCILGAVGSVALLVGLRESFAPLILKRKAAEARKMGHRDAHSEFDGQGKTVGEVVRVYLVRSFYLLATEPILQAVTLYISFVYGILFLFVVSFPISFGEVRHWSLGVSSLPFLSLLVGVILGVGILIIYILKTSPSGSKASKQAPNPKIRLKMMMSGGCMLPIGLFIYAWTSNRNILWPGMVISCIPTGLGMIIISAQCLTYLVDVYPEIANSAIAANGIVRSLFGAGFPLFGPAMYHRLGVAWATSLLAFISIAMLPIPILFYVKGGVIRGWSKKTYFE